MTEEELEKKAESLLKEISISKKSSGMTFTVFPSAKDCYIRGVKDGLEENERLQEMMITCNEKIDDLRRINKKLKTKLENTERKIREISQKCYEVENIESIISDLDKLLMELEE